MLRALQATDNSLRFKFKLGSPSNLDLRGKKIDIVDIIPGLSIALDLFHHTNECFIGDTERAPPNLEGQTSLESGELSLSRVNKDTKQALRPAIAQIELFQRCEQPVSKGELNLAQTRRNKLVWRTLMYFQQ